MSIDGKTITALLLLLASAVTSAAGPKLYVFDCGGLYMNDPSPFSLKPEETPTRELFVPCYLIEHEKGRLLWDAGLPKSVADATGKVSVEYGYLTYDKWIVDQLADMDIMPGDIDYAAYSHLHFDHVGAANYFIKSEILMQKTEWALAFEEGSETFDSSLYDKLKTAEVTLLEGDHDVFGDGSVQIIYAPGHTAGHQVLLVNLEKTGPILLSGDLYHFLESRELRRAPTFNYNAEMTFKSMDKVEALIKKTRATLWIEHEKALADTLNKAPQFYD